MPGDIDYMNLGRMIVPLELNYCQCMLELGEYYEVIEHTTELLEKHKGNGVMRQNLKYVFLSFIPHHFLQVHETRTHSHSLHPFTQLHRSVKSLSRAASQEHPGLILGTESVQQCRMLITKFPPKDLNCTTFT